jgi:hypothetical protein
MADTQSSGGMSVTNAVKPQINSGTEAQITRFFIALHGNNRSIW